MAQTEIYIKLEQNTEVTKPDVYLKDMADVVCSDKNAAAKVPSLQGPCDRSLKSEAPCGSCLNWR